MGVLKTLCCLQDNFFWPHMRQDVSCYMAQCSICQQMKYEAKKLAGLLHPLPIPSAIWEDLSLNFITGLPLSNGYTTIMVVVDRYSKGIHLALFHRTSRHTRLLSCSWIQSVSYMAFHATWYLITIQSSSALFGVTCSAWVVPNSVWARRTTHKQMARRKSSIWSSNNTCAHLFMIIPINVSSFYPWQNGPTTHQCIPIPAFLPSKSLMASHPLLFLSTYRVPPQLRLSIHYFPQGLLCISFSSTDCLSPRMQWRLKLKPTVGMSNFYSKLSKRYYGPYLIEAWVGPVTYHLRLPLSSKIHPVFHVSLLKPHHGPISSNTSPYLLWVPTIIQLSILYSS